MAPPACSVSRTLKMRPRIAGEEGPPSPRGHASVTSGRSGAAHIGRWKEPQHAQNALLDRMGSLLGAPRHFRDSDLHDAGPSPRADMEVGDPGRSDPPDLLREKSGRSVQAPH